MTLDAYIAYCLACILIVIVPGPTVTVIIANSLRKGARAGLLNVAGTQAGLLVWLAIAVFGLASAIKLMGVWFDILRWAGAAYLVWLGIKLILSRGDLAVAADRARPHGSYFLQGFMVILSNPKVLLVFGRTHSAIHRSEWRFPSPAYFPRRDLHGDRDCFRQHLCLRRR